jgi:hypothetical protein
MHNQKRKLQQMRVREKKEQESERQRDEFFNKLQPLVSQQQWRVKIVSEALKEIRVEAIEEREVAEAEIPIETDVNRYDRLATPVEPADEESILDRSDRLATPVRPVNEVSVQTGAGVPSPSQSCSEVTTPVDDEDEMLDYEPSPVREDMYVNVIYYLPWTILL